MTLAEVWNAWSVGEAAGGPIPGQKPPLRLVEQYFKAKWRSTSKANLFQSRKFWERFREIPEWIEAQTKSNSKSSEASIGELEALRTQLAKRSAVGDEIIMIPLGMNALAKHLTEQRKAAVVAAVATTLAANGDDLTSGIGNCVGSTPSTSTIPAKQKAPIASRAQSVCHTHENLEMNINMEGCVQTVTLPYYYVPAKCQASRSTCADTVVVTEDKHTINIFLTLSMPSKDVLIVYFSCATEMPITLGAEEVMNAYCGTGKVTWPPNPQQKISREERRQIPQGDRSQATTWLSDPDFIRSQPLTTLMRDKPVSSHADVQILLDQVWHDHELLRLPQCYAGQRTSPPAGDSDPRPQVPALGKGELRSARKKTRGSTGNS
ncbi:hypothetical protein B0H13DRAFT_1917719 [Mycena leptocephala]|nr:hypothetical protein B0H13DRAFT_1917719 [Mycena leptocephala]